MISIKRSSTTRTAGLSFGARLFLGIAILVILSQAYSLYHRGRRGRTDVGVFYRTTRLLNNGAGGEIYTQRDSSTGWPISIPPAGLALFQPLSHFERAPATLLWAVFNLGLAAVSVLVLHKYVELLERRRRFYRRILPYAAGMLLILASGSIQVGQYSLLFTTCWILALYAGVTRRAGLSGFLWAIPAAIKIYPALLLAAPLSESRRPRDTARQLLLFAAGFGIASILIPFLFYGRLTWELNSSFWLNTIFSPEGRMSEMQSLGENPTNQSLDVFLLRYLHADPDFHTRFPYVPHLNYTAASVLQLANGLRASILILTVGAVWIWRGRGFKPSAHNLLILAALWSATLYLMLPETRGRYAVYAFLAFIPLLAAALAAKILGRERDFVLRGAVLAFCFILVTSLMPTPLRAFGLGLFGALVLWMENIRLMLRHRGRVKV